MVLPAVIPLPPVNEGAASSGDGATSTGDRRKKLKKKGSATSSRGSMSVCSEPRDTTDVMDASFGDTNAGLLFSSQHQQGDSSSSPSSSSWRLKKPPPTRYRKLDSTHSLSLSSRLSLFFGGEFSSIWQPRIQSPPRILFCDS